MPTTTDTYYTEQLQCHCPQCYSTSGLELRFNQEWDENLFRKKATQVVREELYCTLCEDPIYPVNWGDDIERLYTYHKKRATPIKYFRWKSPFWVAMIVLVLLIVAGVYFVLNLDTIVS